MRKKILRLKAVIERTGLSRSLIYKKMADKAFPSPIRLTERTVGWLETDIDEWIETRRKATFGGRKGRDSHV